MPHTISWLLQGRIVHTDFYGEMVAEEIQEATREIIELMDEGDGPLVHVITDTTGLGRYLIKVGLVNSSALDALRHPKMGWSIIISDNNVVKYLSGIVTGISRARFRAFGTLEEGLAFLNQVDSSLPDLLAHEQDDE